MKLAFRSYIYESIGLSSTESKILKAIKNAKKYDESKDNKLYRVGGVVRDEILGVKSKDIDYLVTNVALSDLKDALSQIADSIVSTNVGESMQVIKAVIDGSDEPYDFAIPRTEIYGGSGRHDDLQTFGDPSLPVEADLSRRDINFNAIAKDVETGEYIDPYDGIGDIKAQRIRSVGNANDRFAEDPLRMLRVIQFSNRFGFPVNDETLNAIKSNLNLIDRIKGERILAEFEKAFSKSKFNSNDNFIDLLYSTGLGKHLFGVNFNPIKSNVIYGDKFMVNMALFFMNGGDYKKLKPSNEVSHLIELCRALIIGDPLQVMLKNRKYFNLVKDVMKSTGDNSLISKIESLDGVPLSGSELQISSEFLMSNGYSGKRLGDIQYKMINDIYKKRISNNRTELEEYINSLKSS